MLVHSSYLFHLIKTKSKSSPILKIGINFLKFKFKPKVMFMVIFIYITKIKTRVVIYVLAFSQAWDKGIWGSIFAWV
jgi:hypothetical protein